MKSYPKVQSVSALDGKRLLVNFDNGEQKVYNCNPLLKEEAFRPLEAEWFFRKVKADAGGHGISWNEEIDLAESELWENGVTPFVMPS
jgi:hypothetical protein